MQVVAGRHIINLKFAYRHAIKEHLLLTGFLLPLKSVSHHLKKVKNENTIHHYSSDRAATGIDLFQENSIGSNATGRL